MSNAKSGAPQVNPLLPSDRELRNDARQAAKLDDGQWAWLPSDRQKRAVAAGKAAAGVVAVAPPTEYRGGPPDSDDAEGLTPIGRVTVIGLWDRGTVTP